MTDMALCTIDWRSEVLNKWTSMHVLLPERCEPPYATLYLLHGLSDDYTIWLRQTRIEMYARQYPLLVVMPDGYRGFYTDNAAGPAYAKHIGEELVAFIERTFPAKRTRAARCLSGNSMGGYGALRIGLGYPDKFISVHSHSGALLHGTKLWTRNPESKRIFGPRPAGTTHDLVHLVKHARPLPKLRLDCGTEDFLLAENRDFHARLRQAGIPHEYVEFPGAHNWDYWDLHIREALVFHARHLHLQQLPAW
jgi:S-formylglutathione hydrolase FrmB